MLRLLDSLKSQAPDGESDTEPGSGAEPRQPS